MWVESGHAISVDANSQVGVTSDFNLLHATGTGSIGQWQSVDRTTLTDWQSASQLDENSLSQDPLFVDRDGADNLLGYVPGVSDGSDDDFHLQSTVGRFTGGFAPALHAVTDLPVALASAELTDASQSPAIDRSDDTSAFANESAPNGAFVNIGAYGDTTQASKSPLQYVLVTLPDGGEVWPADQTFPIRWRSHDTAGTVDIELLRDGDAGFSYVVAI